MALALLLFHEPQVYERYFDITYDIDRIEEADVVVFPGGSDWNPVFYGSSIHPSTHYYDLVDQFEYAVAKEAMKLGKKMVGHCRGAQLMCILNGDKLIQNVYNHTSPHLINTHHGDTIEVNSIHHQMMYPTKDYQLLAYSSEMMSPIHEMVDVDGNVFNVKLGIEPEVVWFDKIKGLAVQYHPEWMNINTDGFKYHQRLLEEFIL